MRIKLTVTFEYETGNGGYPFKSTDPRDYVAYDLKCYDNSAPGFIQEMFMEGIPENVIITSIDEVHETSEAADVSLQAEHLRKQM